MTEKFDILHSLRVKGLTSTDLLRALSGVEDIDAATAPLVSDGLVQVREGRFGGYLLTAEGKAEAERELLADEQTTGSKDDLAAFDESFLPINTDFKKVCHSWQMKSDEEPNDHTDAAYDAQVVEQLAACHARIAPPLAQLSKNLPRFGRYEPRLDAALARVRDGDAGAFARPMYDSYHDIWMELHNDVVLSIGRARNQADEQVE